MHKFIQTLFALVLIIFTTHADSITHGSTTINMEFVNIGYAGNMVDSTGYGAVGYKYRIGRLEVTIDQFMKAHKADHRIGDGDEDYWNNGSRSVGTSGPACNMSWYDAAKFCNWLTTGSAHKGAYRFNGSGDFRGVDRDAAISAYGTVYVLPSEDEWYKAAYYKSINNGSYSLYSNGSDNFADLTWGTINGWNYHKDGYLNPEPNHIWEAGCGAEEQNGTCDMTGNVKEWCESAYDGMLDDLVEKRVLRGGAYYNGANSASNRADASPFFDNMGIGFRVAAIPEPTTTSLMNLGAYREFKNQTGKTIQAHIIRYDSKVERVQLELKNRKKAWIQLSDLSEADQAYIQQYSFE